MKLLSTLARTSSGLKHVYAIVFTSLLLYELLKYRARKNVHDSHQGGRNGPSGRGG
jgi:hypothetical protein